LDKSHFNFLGVKSNFNFWVQTIYQSIRHRTSAGETKMEAALKQVAGMSVDDLTKAVADLKATQDEVKSSIAKHNDDTIRVLRQIHEEILVTFSGFESRQLQLQSCTL
jgi:hypothetical protein